MQVEAFDEDLGPNGALEFGLIEGDITPASEVLTIEAFTGEIKVKEPLTGRGQCQSFSVCYLIV